MRAVGRTFAAMLGFVAAVIAAALFMMAAEIGWSAPDPDVAPLYWLDYALKLGLVASMLGSLALLPAAVAILVSEILGIRSLLFHLGVGGGLGLVAAFGLGGPMRGAGEPAHLTFWLAAGFVGGFAYWLVAGRSAGLTPARSPDAGPP